MSDTVSDIAEQIQSDSAIVDRQFTSTNAETFADYSLSLSVPAHHSRAVAISETKFTVANFEPDVLPANSYFLIDANLRNSPVAKELGERAHFVEASEDTLKELSWLENFVLHNVPHTSDPVVGVGGGVLLNAAAFIAEKRTSDFISVPTTILAAADSAIGGLVRINKVEGEQFQKSFYKSVYEPSSIVLDPRLLATLPKEQVSFGLSEVIKHGVYQSSALLEYLASDEFEPFRNQASLIKAVCWTVALKNVAIIHDPDSLLVGGDILRGGHRVALTLEEASHFRVSHGEAVAVGVYQDTLQDSAKLKLLNTIYQKLGLPRFQADLPT